MIINGNKVTGLFKYSENNTYNEDDLVIDLGLLYVCLKEACGKRPSENPEYFTPYPKKKINSAAEYFDNQESDNYISSKALTEILSSFDFGFSMNGVIEDEITYDPNKEITCTILDQIYNYDILDTIMKKPDLNNGMFKVSNNLPEIRNLLLHNSSVNNYIIVKQYTYDDTRVQELLDIENRTIYIRWARKPYEDVSEWYSIVTKDVHDYISEISAYYTSKLRDYESAFRAYQNKFCFKDVPFEEESGTYKIDLESLGLTERPINNSFIINVIASKTLEDEENDTNIKRNYTALVDLSDTEDTYLTTDNNIHIGVTEDHLTLSFSGEGCELKNIYYREKTSLSQEAPTILAYPQISTISCVSTGSSTSTVTIRLVSTGNNTIKEIGVCYSSETTTPNRDNSEREVYSDSYLIGEDITIDLTKLSANTPYYIRAYAVTSDDLVSHGNILSFVTEQVQEAPKVTITEISSGSDSIKLVFNVRSNDELVSLGAWCSDNLSGTPSLDDIEHIHYCTLPKSDPELGLRSSNMAIINEDYILTKENVETQQDLKSGINISMTIDNLSAGKTYLVSAFAKNYTGTTFSDSQIVNTSSTQDIVISIDQKYSSTSNSITCTGRIKDTGGYEIIEKGFIYSTTQVRDPLPLLSTQFIDCSSEPDGEFSGSITELNESSPYYIYAYCKNANNVEKYTSPLLCRTSSANSAPTIDIRNVIALSDTSISAYVNVTDTGGSNITKIGIWYNTTQGSTPSGSDAVTIAWNVGSYTRQSIIVSGLDPETTYYIRGVAENEDDYFGYSEETSVTTLSTSQLSPTLSISSPVSSYPGSISLTGYIDIPNGYTGSVVERGFIYSITDILDIGDGDKIKDQNYSYIGGSSDRGSYSVNSKINTPGSYKFKSYAIDNDGKSYLSDNQVDGTVYEQPSISTKSASAVLSGNNATMTLTGSLDNRSDVENIIGNLGFRYGTSSNSLNSEIVSTGSRLVEERDSNQIFSGIVSVAAGFTYYYQAFVSLKADNSSRYYGTVKSISIGQTQHNEN